MRDLMLIFINTEVSNMGTNLPFWQVGGGGGLMTTPPPALSITTVILDQDQDQDQIRIRIRGTRPENEMRSTG
jgi:hypothetical protein